MKIQPLIQDFEIENFIPQLLAAYGIDNIDNYLCPSIDDFDPAEKYPNIENVYNILKNSIEKDDNIAVVVDSDADGVFSAFMLYDFLRKNGRQATMIFHKSKAHGASDDVMGDIIDLRPKLLIIPDAAFPKGENAKILHDLGIKVLVLDHHLPNGTAPSCTMVNPYLNNDLNHSISGTGVVYKFIDYYCSKESISVPPYLDLVACSIISDSCHITQENRAFIYFGLSKINNPMLKMMFQVLAPDVTPKSVGWSIAPKINALTRVNTSDLEILFNAFCGEDMSAGIEVAQDAYEKQNSEITKAMNQMVIDSDHKIVYAFIDNQYQSLTGLIANKIMSEYQKPTFVLREKEEGIYTGSLRSPFDIAEALNSTKLCKVMGHEAAAGIIIKKENFDKLIDWCDGQPFDSDPAISVTAILKPKQITKTLCEDCQNNKNLFANEIREPSFYSKISVPKKSIQIFKKKFTTVKINFDNLSFVKFRVPADEVELIESSDYLDIELIYSLSINEYAGKKSCCGTVEKWELKKGDFEF